ncbi:hypothetical protein [Microbacterium sp. 77mftsu3.1]|uniref:hypothetical protein n=1 Tax=Microbacterium sp. 77mftsu3.1 TaxID=1761802 RepID=UPI00039E9DF1|nr:hypothetical protein [Microbacterium sp. 77mftsu3.1]SDG21154.1 hypothetical protein SAMN04488590_0196 [Microbacterium sp. 77mftsu3.1]
MYIGTIRPDETRTADLTGNSLEEIHAAAVAQLPTGFELVSAPVRMIKGSTALTATATFRRVDGIREVEADTRDGLDTIVPAGWQLLTVRTV